MPCYVTGSAEGDARLSAQEAHKEATKVTRLLCSLLEYLDECRHLEAFRASVWRGMPPEVLKYWEKHQEIDRERSHQERVANARREEQEREILRKLKAKYE